MKSHKLACSVNFPLKCPKKLFIIIIIIIIIILNYIQLHSSKRADTIVCSTLKEVE